MNETEFWASFGRVERTFYRVHNVVGRVTMPIGDDTTPIQTHQIQGYTGEVRDSLCQRHQLFGFSSMPLPGAQGVAVYQSGHRGFSTIIADEDSRYRPTGLQPGEHQVYMVDGAAGDGSGGTTRTVLKAALGWALSLFGKTIAIGTQADTINLVLNGQTVNITGTTGDVVINGVSQVNHVHSGVTPGSGNSGPPVQGA